MTDLLEHFTGIGEVRGFKFTRICATNRGFVYEVDLGVGIPHYEVFERKIDKRFQRVSYPRSKSFGKWAWTYGNLEKAKQKLGELNNDIKNNPKIQA